MSIEIHRSITNIYKGEFDTAGSYPGLFECCDGKSYVTKWAGLDRRKDVINELIAGLLAKQLGLSIPNFALIEIIPEIFDVNDHFHRGKPYGLGFGSEFLADPNKPIINFNNIKNLPTESKNRNKSLSLEFIEIILFDIWLRNDDRNINNPNVIIQENRGDFCIFAIDHVSVFAGHYYLNLEKEIYESPTLEDTMIQDPYFEKVINSFGFFREKHIDIILERIEKFPILDLYKFIEAVPNEWKLSNLEGECVVNFLEKRKTLVKDQFYNLLAEAGY